MNTVLPTLNSGWRALLILALIISYSTSMSGQTGSVSGVLLDESSQPVAYSTLTLITPDSVLAGGSISEDDGRFSINNVSPGEYILVAQHIEYATYSSDAFVIKGNEKKDFGEIAIERSSVRMDEIVVEGKRALVEVHADKMVFNVANSVNASGSDGLELLNKAPGVIVDPDNNIVLQGKSGVRIFINGRPSRLSGSDLATMLQSMQSDNILLIEIITNPSVRYEAEGNAGIINIKLKNNITLGYNGSLISSYSKGSHPRMSHGLTLNYGKDRLSANINVTRFDNVFQEEFVDIKYQNGFLVDLDSYEEKDKFGFNLSAGLDYQIADDHAISLSARSILTEGDYELNSTTDIFQIDGPAVETLVSQTLTGYQSNNFNYSLNYNWDIGANTSWNTDVSYGSFLNDRRIDQPNTYLDPDGEFREEINNSFEPYTVIDLWAVKSDFDHDFDRISLSTGVKYTNILTDNQFVVNDVINGEDIKDVLASNDFSYKEEVFAGYVTSNYEISDKFNLSAGLRIEHTRSDARLESEQVTQDDVVKREYTNLFPNVSLSFNDGGKNEISLGVGRRLSRPDYQDLNPFESKLSELSLFKGNPFLNPRYVTNYQLSYVFDQKLVVSNTFSVTKDFFAKIVSINETKGVVVIPRNMDRAIDNGLSVSYSQEMANWWDVISYLSYNYSLFQGEFDQTVIDFSQNIYNIRLQNNLSLPWDVTLDVTGYWNSPSVWRGTVIIDEYWGIEFGIKKTFWNDRLQLRFTGNDIFNTSSDYGYYGNYGGLEFDGYYGSDRQRFGASVTLKFGNNKIRKKSRRSSLDEEMRRISE